MHDAVQTLRYVDIGGFAGVALLAVRTRRKGRGPAGTWAAAAFGSLGLLELLALVPNHPGNLAERALGRFEIVLLVLFPYLLFRFTIAFRKAAHPVANAVFALTSVVVAWALAMPRIPQAHEGWPWFFSAFVAVFLLHWTALSLLTAARLVLAGRDQPSVARRRMELLAFATAAITVAIFLVAFRTATFSDARLGAFALAAVAVAAFALGLSPPALLRIWWRRPEQARLQSAIASLTTFAETQEEVAERVLGPAAAIVGARALAIRNDEGAVVGAWNVPPEAWAPLERRPVEVTLPAEPDAEVVELDVPGGSIVVWTSSYAPFFGAEELDLLRTLGGLTGLALDRVRLFQAEHETRLALERANEVKSSFVALAAHELRTPMTTIHGFVTTLHHLEDRLSERQRGELRDGLLHQTQRMAVLIEQLLDLSRLDAEAIEIAPEPLPVRQRLEEIVEASARDRAGVEVEVRDDLVALVDRNALERIVSNLVTNAFRYGRPPIVVRADQTDRHFRLTVEDCGSGVPAAFVPDLFERFTRSAEARGRGSGTGLGLAIARSYARAHGGDLLYEDAAPHGARFRLVLPAAPAAAQVPAGEPAAEVPD